MQPTFICFSHNLNYALGWTVVHSLWQAIAIALISGVVMIVLRKKTAQTRYLIGNLSLAAVLVSAIVTFCIYYDFSKEAGQLVLVEEEMPNVITADVPAIAPQSEIQNPQSEILSWGGLKDYFNSHIYLIVTMWVMGVALFMLRLLGSISYVYYLRSRLNFPADEYWQDMLDSLRSKVHLNVPIELMESALVRSPLVVGYFKPMILFPIGAINKLNTSEVEAILSHELAHVMRHDYVFNIIQSVIEALFFYHPAVWWLSAQIRTERENCADDIAIALCGNSMTYARALVSVQEFAMYGNPQMAMAFAGQKQNQLLTRVQRILKQPQNKVNIMEKLIATSILLFTLVTLSFSSRFENTNYAANALIDNGLAAVETPSVVEPFLPADLGFDEYLRYKYRGKKDSLKLDTPLSNGKYNYADNTIKMEINVEDGWVTYLNLNGVDMKPDQIPNFEQLIRKAVRRLPQAPASDYLASIDAPAAPSVWSNDVAAPAAPAAPAPAASAFSNDPNRPAVAPHPYPMAAPRPPAPPVVNSNNGAIESFYPNGQLHYSEQNGSTTEYYENGGLKYQRSRSGSENFYYPSGQLKRQKDASGSVREYRENGTMSQSVDVHGETKQYAPDHRVFQSVDNQGNVTQYDRFGRVIQQTKGNAVVTENFIGDDGGSTTLIDSKNNQIVWRAADGAKYVMKYNDKGGYEIKMFDKNGGNYKTINLRNGKIYANDKEMSEAELNRMGFEYKDKGLQRIGGYNNIRPSENYQNNARSSNCNDCDDRIERIENRVEKLLDQMDECDCRETDPNWFTWANARLVAQNGLIQANRNDRGLTSIENEVSQIEKQFAKIKAKSKGDKGSKGGKNEGTQEDAIHAFFQALLDDGLIKYSQKAEVRFNNNWLIVGDMKINHQANSKYWRVIESVLGYKPNNFVINYEGIINGSRGNLSITGKLSTATGKD